MCRLLFSSVLKTVTTYPPPQTHTFLKRPFLTDFKKHTHTPRYGTKFGALDQNLKKPPKNCEFAPSWLDVPERYTLISHNRTTPPPLGSTGQGLVGVKDVAHYFGVENAKKKRFQVHLRQWWIAMTLQSC